MHMFARWLVRMAIVLIIAALVVGFWKKDEIKRLLAVNSLFSEETIVFNFSNMNQAFLHRDVYRGDGPVSDLPRGTGIELPQAVHEWITERSVTSLLVLKRGVIVHESYHLGTGPEDRRISWSMAKSFLSALVGILVTNGEIDSLESPVTKYAPALSGTAYDGATIRDVLHMASGVKFDEDYLDPKSDINRMGRVLALGGTMDDFTTSITGTISRPGDKWKYVSIDTHVIAMVVRGATGRDLPTLLSEFVIAPLGLEASPYYLTDGVGVAFALGGLNMRTRDYARFGLMFEQNGSYGNTQVVPADWVSVSTQPTAPTEVGKTGYGYQWWVPNGANTGVFMARGVYGQYIYIDQTLDTVIVTTGADRKFRDVGVSDRNIAIFRTIATAL